MKPLPINISPRSKKRSAAAAVGDAVPGIYRITNMATGDTYIGAAKSVRTRVLDHARQLRRGIHPNRRLQESFAGSGMAAFAAELIHAASMRGGERRGRGRVYRLERFFIRRLKPSLNCDRELKLATVLGKPLTLGKGK